MEVMPFQTEEPSYLTLVQASAFPQHNKGHPVNFYRFPWCFQSALNVALTFNIARERREAISPAICYSMFTTLFKHFTCIL